jgi:hypothetical protein
MEKKVASHHDNDNVEDYGEGEYYDAYGNEGNEYWQDEQEREDEEQEEEVEDGEREEEGEKEEEKEEEEEELYFYGEKSKRDGEEAVVEKEDFCGLSRRKVVHNYPQRKQFKHPDTGVVYDNAKEYMEACIQQLAVSQLGFIDVQPQPVSLQQRFGKFLPSL